VDEEQQYLEVMFEGVLSHVNKVRRQANKGIWSLLEKKGLQKKISELIRRFVKEQMGRESDRSALYCAQLLNQVKSPIHIQ